MEPAWPQLFFFVCLECHQPGFDSLDDFEGFSLAALGDLDYFGIFHVALPCGALSHQIVWLRKRCGNQKWPKQTKNGDFEAKIQFSMG